MSFLTPLYKAPEQTGSLAALAAFGDTIQLGLWETSQISAVLDSR